MSKSDSRHLSGGLTVDRQAPAGLPSLCSDSHVAAALAGRLHFHVVIHRSSEWVRASLTSFITSIYHILCLCRTIIGLSWWFAFIMAMSLVPNAHYCSDVSSQWCCNMSNSHHGKYSGCLRLDFLSLSVGGTVYMVLSTAHANYAILLLFIQ